jgi:hypothetical protein
VTQVVDPDTHATVTARQDLMMRVDYPNHDLLVLFADGTRVSHQPDIYDWQVSFWSFERGSVSRPLLSLPPLSRSHPVVQVECEGYATVQRKGSTITVDIGQGVLSYNVEDQSMTLEMGEWGALVVCGCKVRAVPAHPMHRCTIFSDSTQSIATGRDDLLWDDKSGVVCSFRSHTLQAT